MTGDSSAEQLKKKNAVVKALETVTLDFYHKPLVLLTTIVLAYRILVVMFQSIERAFSDGS